MRLFQHVTQRPKMRRIGGEGQPEWKRAPRISLLIQQKGNRRALERALGTRYDIAAPERVGWPPSADLLIIDGPSLAHHGEMVREIRKTDPVYLPVLLVLTADRQAVRVDPTLFDQVDDMIYRPVARAEFLGRVRALLRTRRYAVQSHRQIQKLRTITEQVRESEQRHRVSEAFLTATIDALSEHVAVLDETGTILRVNEAWRRFAAANGAEGKAVGTGINYLDVCEQATGPSAEGADAIAEAIREIAARRCDLFTHEYPCHSPSEERWFTLKLTRFDIDDSTYVVAVHENITDRKRHEQNLIGAKKEAEKMNRLKTAFLANMSHEIRTPLTSIIGFAEVLKDKLDGEALDLIDVIYTSGDRLKKTLTSVLDLAQLESDSMTLQPEPVDLAEEVHDLGQMFQVQAQKKQIALRVDCPEHPVMATVDVGAFQRVITNLVTNAIKFTDEGAVRLDLHASDERVEVTVEDTGIGISKEMQEQIFQAFKQESDGLAREYEGSGLGLAITKQLVELMDGTIRLRSEKGTGSVFTVELPRGPAPKESAG